MDSVRKANARLRNYPVLLAQCAEPAAAYAACVTRDLNAQQNSCVQEFDTFRKCLQRAAKDMKTKL